MKKILEILTKHKYAIIWTFCYVAMMWLVLRFMFNFDMFSVAYWRHLIHANLRGFPGFVFGILVLAALPIYIATTTLIIRTKKPLFTIPTPKFISAIWARMQPTLINPPATKEETNESKSNKETKSDSDDLPDGLPSELRTAYIRARMNITPEQRSSFNQPTLPGTPTQPTPTEQDNVTTDQIPLPSDFDIEPNTEPDFSADNFAQMAAPTFTDITFGDTPETDTPNPISEYLTTIGKKHEIVDNIVITDKHAIASHTDNDFWVCDDDFWFATGKQIESPIKQLITCATEHNLNPILYLGPTNIMNLDKLQPAWESMGIIIINEPTEIPE